MSSKTASAFPVLIRLLHWSMALLIIAQLYIGLAVVNTVSSWHAQLLSFHKPLGFILLILAATRLILRLILPIPALPSDLPAWQKYSAKASHFVLYLGMLGIPLIGWAMLSAGAYPVSIGGGMVLPALMAPNAAIYPLLRWAHQFFAYAFFMVIIVHIMAGMYHALIRKDNVFNLMRLIQKNKN